MDKKTGLAYMLSTRDPPQNKRFTQAESEGLKKKIIPCKGKWKKDAVVILISNKIDLKTKAITADKEDYSIILKGVNSTRGHKPCKHTQPI